MAEIQIPYSPDMKAAAINGSKICTSRNRKYGKVGDTFILDGQKFRLLIIDKFPLEMVATLFFREEGFNCPNAFKDKWKALHLRRGWEPEREVFVHFFRKVE